MRQNIEMIAGKVGERLAFGLFCVVLASYLIACYAGFTYNMIVHMSDTAVAALWHNGDLLLVEGSDYVQIAPHALTFMPWIEAEQAAFLHTDIWTLEKWRSMSGVVVGLAGLYLTGRTLSGSALVAVLVTVAIPASWLATATIGYGFDAWSGRAQLGVWGTGAMLCVWALWLNPRLRQPWLPWALAGMVANIHPIYGFILLFVLGVDGVVVIGGSTDRTIAIRGLLVRGGISILVCLPQLVLALQHFGGDASVGAVAVVEDDWWRLMYARVQHHVFFWRNPWRVLGFATNVIFSATLLVMARPLLESSVVRRLWVTLASVIFLVAVMFVNNAYVHSAFLTALSLFRANSLLPGMVVALAIIVGLHQAALIANDAPGGRWRRVLLVALPVTLCGSGVAMVAASILIQIGGAVGAGAYLSGPGVRVVLAAWVERGPAFAVQFLAGLGLVVLAARGTRHGRRALIPLLVVACLAEGVWHGSEHLMSSFRGEQPTELHGWMDLARWMRTETPTDALFLMPPQPGYTSTISHRSTVIDSKSLSFPFYMPSTTARTLGLFEAIYGIDLRDMSLAELDAFYNTPYTLAMERRYERLDSSGLRSIMELVPGIDYVVGYRPGADGHYRYGGPFQGSRLDLPVVYENIDYIVYDADALTAR